MLVKLWNNFTCVLSNAKGEGNYQDLVETRVKFFPDFTRYHLITHTS